MICISWKTTVIAHLPVKIWWALVVIRHLKSIESFEIFSREVLCVHHTIPKHICKHSAHFALSPLPPLLGKWHQGELSRGQANFPILGYSVGPTLLGIFENLDFVLNLPDWPPLGIPFIFFTILIQTVLLLSRQCFHACLFPDSSSCSSCSCFWPI
jgi:hypothetical protein